jgi:hypothetical protein
LQAVALMVSDANVTRPRRRSFCARFIDNWTSSEKARLLSLVTHLRKCLREEPEDSAVRRSLLDAASCGDVTVEDVQWLCATEERRDLVYKQSVLIAPDNIPLALANGHGARIGDWRTRLSDVSARLRYILTRVITALRAAVTVTAVRLDGDGAGVGSPHAQAAEIVKIDDGELRPSSCQHRVVVAMRLA